MKKSLQAPIQSTCIVLGVAWPHVAAQDPIDLCDLLSTINPPVFVEASSNSVPSPLKTLRRAKGLRPGTPIDLDFSRYLPIATGPELSSDLSNLFQRFGELLEVRRPTMRDARTRLPELFDQSDEIWVPDRDAYSWRIRSDQGHQDFWSGWHGRVIVCSGMVLINADLRRVKAAERDYRAFVRFLGDEYHAVYPIEDSYMFGEGDQGRFTQIDLFYKARGRLGCLKSAELRLRVRERCVENLIITDYYADSASPDYYWLAGRDLFCPVYGNTKEPVAFIILTQFGFDITDCLDSEINVRRHIRKHLEFWKGRAEKK